MIVWDGLGLLSLVVFVVGLGVILCGYAGLAIYDRVQRRKTNKKGKKNDKH